MSSVIEHPLVTEKAMNQMDFDNKLQFVVSLDATKSDVADEVASRYDVTVEGVHTMVTARGQKKAIVTLGEDDDAQEIASRIGVF